MKPRTQDDPNNFGPFCDETKERCGNTEHAPGETGGGTTEPGYTSKRPFALETHFDITEGNIERHIAYPTSRLPLWFGGGHSSGQDRGDSATTGNGPWYCDFNTGSACGNSATDDNRGEVNGEFGPYAGNIPCYDCWQNAAHQFENVIAAMVKRYGPDAGATKHFGCQNDAKSMGTLNYDNDFFFPGTACASRESAAVARPPSDPRPQARTSIQSVSSTAMPTTGKACATPSSSGLWCGTLTRRSRRGGSPFPRPPTPTPTLNTGGTG